MPSIKDVLDFLEKNWKLIHDNFPVFLFFCIICVSGTWFVLHLVHKKTIVGLIKEKEEAIEEGLRAKEVLNENLHKVTQLSQELSSIKKENERLREQYKRLSIEGKIVASRESPKGVAAEKISQHFQKNDYDIS